MPSPPLPLVHAAGQVAPLQAEVVCNLVARNERFTLHEWLLPGGSSLQQQFPGDLIVHCHGGEVAVRHGREEQGRREHLLKPGESLVLPPHEPCDFEARQASVLLLTAIEMPEPEIDSVDEASEESFPASDPPGFTGTAI